MNSDSSESNSSKNIESQNSSSSIQYTKATIQTIPLGKIACTIYGPSEWEEADRAQRWFELLNEIRYQVLETIPYSGITRLFVATSDIFQEISRWQQELDLVEAITNDEEAETVGKSFVWGDGKSDSTYGIVIINERLAAQIVDDGNLSKLAKSLVIHELAHIHDYYVRLGHFGPESPPTANNWVSIKQSIAMCLWGEFFAEKIASIHQSEKEFKVSLELTAKIIQLSLKKLSHAKNQYLNDRNINVVWQIAGSELSQILNQIGRMLGIACAWKTETRNDLFANFVSDAWVQLIVKLYDELKTINTMDDLSQKLPALRKCVKEGMKLLGLRVKQVQNAVLLQFVENS